MVNKINYNKIMFLDIETTGLNPVDHKITCIAAKIGKDKFLMADNNESDLLNKFGLWCINLDHKICKSVLVTKNGKMFDLPFLAYRIVGILGILSNKQLDDMVNLCGFILESPPTHIPHFDLQEVCKSRVSLDDMANLYGLETKSSTGLQAIQWFKEGKLNNIEEYCWNDILVTEKVFRKWVKLHKNDKRLEIFKQNEK